MDFVFHCVISMLIGGSEQSGVCNDMYMETVVSDLYSVDCVLHLAMNMLKKALYRI